MLHTVFTKPLQKIHEPRHGHMRLPKGSQTSEIFPIAICNSLIHAKAAFQARILPCVSISEQKGTLLPAIMSVYTEHPIANRWMRDKLTCDKTTTPSRERCTSVSTACAPASTAARIASRLFSGHAALYPLWAMACGKRRVGFEVDGRAVVHGAEDVNFVSLFSLFLFSSSLNCHVKQNMPFGMSSSRVSFISGIFPRAWSRSMGEEIIKQQKKTNATRYFLKRGQTTKNK